MTFVKGVSGNPKGKAKGTRDWRSKLRTKIEDAAPTLIADLLEQAKSDPRVMMYLFNKVIPDAAHRDEPVKTALSLTGSPADQADQVGIALAAGKITRDDAKAILDSLATATTIRASSELSTRIEHLEKIIATLAPDATHGT